MSPKPHVEGFTDENGRYCLFVTGANDTAPAAPVARWDLLVTLGPRTLKGMSGSCVLDPSTPPAEQVRAVALRSLSRCGSFGIVEDDDTRRAVVRTLDAARGSPALDRLLAATGAASVHCALGDLSLQRLRSLDGRCGSGTVDAFAAAYPFLVPAVGLVDERLRPDAAASLVSTASEGRGPLAEALRRTLGIACHAAEGGDPIPAMLRALGGIPLTGFPACHALAAAAQLPADWVPRGGAEARAFGTLATLAASLSERSGGVLSPAVLLGPARGRWAAFLDGVATSAGAHADVLKPACAELATDRGRADAAAKSLAGEAADMVEAFAMQCAAPIVCRAEAVDAAEADLSYATEHLCLGLPRDPGGLLSAGWRILLGGKGLVSVLRSSADWHARQSTMDLALRTAADPRRWKVPFGDFVSEDGTGVVPLASAADLAAEGAALRHCVGGYAGKCIAGRTVILSVRTGGTEGPRSSTAEILLTGATAQGWGAELVQHKALSNAMPGDGDVRAVAALVAALATGRHPVAPVAVRRLRRRITARLGLAWDEEAEPGRDALQDACGYDWRRPGLCETALATWSRFLPRGPARTDPDVLAAELALQAPLLDLPAARSHRPRSPVLRRAKGIADLAVPAFAAIFAVVAIADAARPRIPRRPQEAVMPSAASDAAIAVTLRPIAESGGAPCPDWVSEGPGEGVPRCGRQGGALVAARGGTLTAHLVGSHPQVEIFRRWKDDSGAERTAWPAGRQWAGWLSSLVAGSPPL